MKKDNRNLCPKFLSSVCPNNCHYTDWCKYEKEIKKEPRQSQLHLFQGGSWQTHYYITHLETPPKQKNASVFITCYLRCRI